MFAISRGKVRKGFRQSTSGLKCLSSSKYVTLYCSLLLSALKASDDDDTTRSWKDENKLTPSWEVWAVRKFFGCAQTLFEVFFLCRLGVFEDKTGSEIDSEWKKIGFEVNSKRNLPYLESRLILSKYAHRNRL